MSTKKRVLKSMGYPLAACAAFAVMNTAVFAETDENQPDMAENQASETTMTNDQQTSAEPSIEETEQQQQDEIDQINEAIDEREKKQAEINAVPENNRTEESAVKNQEENEILKPAVQVKKAPAQQPLKANEAEKTGIHLGGYSLPFGWGKMGFGFGYQHFYPDDETNSILSFESNGLFKDVIEETSINSDPITGKTFISPQDSSTWELIGFVPVHRMNGANGYPYRYDRWDAQELTEYFFNSKEEAISSIMNQSGVLYGEKATDDLLVNNGFIYAVWYRKEIVVPTNQDSEYRGITPVPAVNYQKTTDGLEISATVSKEGIDSHVIGKVIYTVRIPKGMNAKELNINTLNFMVKDEETGELKPVVVPGLQPGDAVEYEIHIIDESGEYKYKEKSGAEGTIPFTKEDYEEKISTGFEGYDLYNTKDKSQLSMVPRRGFNRPIATLLLDEYKRWNMSIREIYNDVIRGWGWDATIGDALISHGYGKELAEKVDSSDDEAYKACAETVARSYLHKYYLDWFSLNNSEDKKYSSFDELTKEQIGILYKSDNAYQHNETDPDAASGLYWGFYEYLYTVSGDGEDYKGSYTWMKKPAGFTDEDGNAFDEVTSSQWKSSRKVVGDAVEYVIRYFSKIDGEYNDNNVQDTKYFIGVQFKLEKDEPDIPEPPKPEEPGEPEKPTPPEPEEPGEPVAPTPEQPKIEVATGVFVDAQLWMSLMGASAVSLAGARRLKRRNRTK